jgi:putative spermidine/putrescine transport system permease protein
VRRHGPDPLSVAFAVGLVLVGLYMLAPIIFVVVNSFNSASYNVFPPEGFSLRWYQNALSVPRFRGAFVNSVLVGLGATAVSLVLGTMSARVLTRWRFTGQSFLRSFFFAPVLVPRIALGAALFLLYIRVGLYGGLFGLIVAHALLGLPFVISIMTAVMYNIDPSQEEAAQDLGCNPIEPHCFSCDLRTTHYRSRCSCTFKSSRTQRSLRSRPCLWRLQSCWSSCSYRS